MKELEEQRVCVKFCCKLSKNFTETFQLLNQGYWGKSGSMWSQGTYSAGVCLPLKSEKCHLFIPSPMPACPRHDTWERLWTAKYCKGETGVPDAIIGTNQLREITPTENPRSSKLAGVEHKASNLVL